MNKRPNILWIMTDEQRADSLGCYGNSWIKTPFIDNLANNGCRFDNAYTTSPVCAPARASILTGKSPASIKLMNNDDKMDDCHAHFLTEHFADAGYQTASFGKHHYNNDKKAFQVQGGDTLGDHVGYFDYLVDKPENADEVRYEGGILNWLFAGKYPGTIEDTPEMANIQEALSYLDTERNKEQPFLLRLSINAPHTPVVVPEPYDTMYSPEEIDIPLDYPVPPSGLASHVYEYFSQMAGNHNMTKEQILRSRQCYFGCVTMVDDLMKYFFEELNKRGALENTIVAFVSDHGAHLGDYGFFQKQSYFDTAAKVPFFISGPGIDTNQSIQAPVSTGSLLPTLLELAGLPIPEGTQYASLANELTSGNEPEEKTIFSEIDFGCWGYRDGDRYIMARKDNWKLSLFRDAEDSDRLSTNDGLMLFNLEDDPEERNNLASNYETRMRGQTRSFGAGKNRLSSEAQSVIQDLLKDIDEWDGK